MNRYKFHSSQDEYNEWPLIFLTLAINIAFLYSQYFLIAIIWPTIGLLWFTKKIDRDSLRFQSDKWTEFLVALQVPGSIYWSIYMWPIDILLTLSNWGPSTSFRDALEFEIHEEKMDDIAHVSGRDNAIFAARRLFARKIERTKIVSKKSKEMSTDVVINAQTAYACGATVATLATSQGLSADEALHSSTNVTISSYGWVTLVKQEPAPEAETLLKFARIRTIITAPAINTSLFTEVDAAPFQTENPDWLKQCFLTYKASPVLSLSLGRMATAPIWLSPPPFLSQTISYPRLPFSPISEALEADIKIGEWHIIEDITARSGSSFDASGQFETIENCLRVERTLPYSTTLSLTTQIGESFERVSLDFVNKRISWLDCKGAMYYSQNNVDISSTDSFGAYLFLGVRPIPTIPNLEFHTQMDYKDTPHNRGPDIITTAGVRVLLGDGKYSITADYQNFRYTKGLATDTLALRLQVRF